VPLRTPTTNTSESPSCGASALQNQIATLTLTSLSSPTLRKHAMSKIATLTKTRLYHRPHRAPLLLVHEGPQRWYRPCTTFQKILVPPIRYPWITRPPIRYPPWYHWEEPSSRCLARCPEHRRKHATQNSALWSFGLQIWRKHAIPIADTRALVSGTVINYLYLYFGVLLISFNTIHSILRMVYVR